MERTQFIGGSSQHPVVVRSDVSKGCKTTAIDEGINVETGDSPRIIGRHFHVDMTWVAATIDPVDFFAVKGNSNGPAGFAGQQSSAHLVREGVGFSSKSSAHKGSNDVDLVHRDIQYRRKCTVRVVRYLLRRVELKSSVGVPMSHHGVWFSESVMNTGHRPGAVRGGMRCIHQRAVSKFLEHTLLNIGSGKVVFSTPMNGFVVVFQPFLGVKNWLQFFPFDIE